MLKQWLKKNAKGKIIEIFKHLEEALMKEEGDPVKLAEDKRRREENLAATQKAKEEKGAEKERLLEEQKAKERKLKEEAQQKFLPQKPPQEWLAAVSIIQIINGRRYESK